MSYSSFETSVEAGQPVELFEFRIGLETFRYTSSQLEIVNGGLTYAPSPITRSDIGIAINDSSVERLEVIVPADNAFAAKYKTYPPGQRATFTLRRVHRPDPEAITLFKGTLRNISFSEDGRQAVMQFLPLTSGFGRTIPRFTYSGQCNHMLYDARCKIDKDNPSFKHQSQVTAVSGVTITVAGVAAFSGSFADFFVAGYVEFDNDFRAIVAQSGDVLTLISPFGVNPLNEIVIVRAGCKQRIVEDCTNKFNNAINFGGFPWVPKKNPFITGLD